MRAVRLPVIVCLLSLVHDICLCLSVEFRLRGDADILHSCLQLCLVEKAQFAVGFVIRDDARIISLCR